MSVANEIITLLGGIRPLARELKHKRHSTVQGWKERGAIPSKHWAQIMQIASDSGIDLKPEHFLGTSPLPKNLEANNPKTESVQQ